MVKRSTLKKKRGARRRTLRGGWWKSRTPAPPSGLQFEPLTLWQRMRGLRPIVRLPKTFSELVGEQDDNSDEEIARKEAKADEISEYLLKYYPDEYVALLKRSDADALKQGETLGRISAIHDEIYGTNRWKQPIEPYVRASKFNTMTFDQLRDISEEDIDKMSPENSRAYLRALKRVAAERNAAERRA